MRLVRILGASGDKEGRYLSVERIGRISMLPSECDTSVGHERNRM